MTIIQAERLNASLTSESTFDINVIFEEINQLKEDVIDKLSCLAAELEGKQKYMTIAKIIFACTGIAGTGLAIAGAIAAPFTFGVSLGLTIAGVSVGGASGLGGAATATADYIVNSKQMKEAEASIAKYQEKMNEIMTTFDTYKNDKTFLEMLSRFVRAGLDAGGHGLHFAATFGAAGARTAAATAGRTTASALSASLKGLMIGGIVLSVLTLPLDFHTLVSNSLKIHRNTPSATAGQIREMAKDVKQHLFLSMAEEGNDASPPIPLLAVNKGKNVNMTSEC